MPLDATDSPSIPALRRRRALGLAVMATTGVLSGVAATPAAATTSDCTAENTSDASIGGSTNRIQELLDEDLPVVCISGAFEIDFPLTVNHDVTILGLTEGVLEGDGADTLVVSQDGASLTVKNLTLTGGSDGLAGAIVGTTVTISDSVLTGNSGLIAGAVLGNSVTIDDSIIESNSAQSTGAIYSYGAITVTGTTFLDNDGGYGGALSANGQIDVTNSTFVGNTGSEEGGAIYARAGRVAFSTFLDNTSAAPADGIDVPGESIYLEAGSGTPLALRGNIFAGSRNYPQLGIGFGVTQFADEGGNVFSTTVDTEADLESPSASTTFSHPTSTIFGPAPELAVNGGITPTVALTEGSPAIDVVPVSTGTTQIDVVVDQRGEPRDERLDAGSFEFQAVEPEPQPESTFGPTPEPTSKPELAATGATADAALLSGVAGAILLGGAVLLRLARRRIS